MHHKILGFLLVLCGVLLMIFKFDLASPLSMISWPFFLFLIGALFVFIAILKTNGNLALFGGFIGSLGLAIWGHKYVKGWPTHWSLLAGLFGLSFLMHSFLSKNKVMSVVGTVFILIGLFAWPGIRDVPFLSPVTAILHTVWPMLVVILGIFFLTKK
jgi:hypothetical protein